MLRPGEFQAGTLMTAIGERLLTAAAWNNAVWCNLFAGVHGVRGVFEPEAWTSSARTPDLYPDAVTLRRSVDARWLVSRIDRSPGSSIKDSFADLDLRPWGFDRLFEASWIHAPDPAAACEKAAWAPVRSDAVLSAWEAAWGRPRHEPRFFPPALLARDDVVVLAAMPSGDVVEAGAILSLGGDAVGVSNLFLAEPASRDRSALAAAFRAAAAASQLLFPGLPIVGYQRGDGLVAAVDAGFEALGPLVVWRRS